MDWLTVDVYLAKIVSDPNLLPSNLIELSRLLPKSPRSTHEGLYRDIDIYLKEYLYLTRGEKEQTSAQMDELKIHDHEELCNFGNMSKKKSINSCFLVHFWRIFDEVEWLREQQFEDK